MKHNWVKYHIPFKTIRKCANCGKEQSFQCISYDRMNGGRYAWRPLVGKCKGVKTAEVNRTQ